MERTHGITHIKCLNPPNAVATFVLSTRMQRFFKPSKPCHVGTHRKGLAEHSQMSTHFPRVSMVFHNFVFANLAVSSIRDNNSSVI